MNTKPINGGGPACSRCSLPSLRRQGHQWLCAKHYRYGQMRAHAKRHGKRVPTHSELDLLAHPENRCADCNMVMQWLGRDERVFVATLQHYRDGSLALVCRSCNSRHAAMPGDSYRGMPKDCKFCPKCLTVKPFNAFSVDSGRTGPMKLKSWCKQCSSAAVANWKR